MVINKTVDIKVNAANFKHYSKFYTNIKCGDTINVDINQLTKGCNIKIDAKCDICGLEKTLSYSSYYKNYNKYNIYTCRKCAKFKIAQTSLDKYGVDNPAKSESIKNKIINTNNLKYGVDYSFQSNEIKEKIKITNNLKYGVDYPQQNEQILKKSNNTNIKKYGFSRSSKNEKVKNKISKKLKDHWNNKLLSEYDILSISGNSYELMCECNNHTFFIEKTLLNNRKYFKTKICTICNKINSNLGQQQNILSYIISIYDGEILNNTRKFLNNKLEIDIFLPELNLGFEYNGLYWHSDGFLDCNYHYNKYMNAKTNNIQLIQIFEDDWLFNQDMVKENIYNRIHNNMVHIDDIIKIDNMNPYKLDNYKVIENLPPIKYFVKKKIRYNYEIESYDCIVYDAGSTVYKRTI